MFLLIMNGNNEEWLRLLMIIFYFLFLGKKVVGAYKSAAKQNQSILFVR